jgi:mycofactocin precursor
VLPLALGVTNVRGTQPRTLPEAAMPETPLTDAAVLEGGSGGHAALEEELVEESLVEEVSIDGMCGVY